MVLTSNKRGQVGMGLLVPAVLALIMAGFFLVMGLVMMDELLIDQADTSGTVVYETEDDVSNVSDEQCAEYNECGFNSFSIINVTNATGGEIVASGNYTTSDTRECTWMLSTAGAAGSYNGTSLNVSYTYSYSTTEACLATNNSIAGLGRFGDYVDLIAVGIIIAIVITLVVGMIAVRRVR